MKSIINIIILILLSLSLYIIPLNTTAFDFRLGNVLHPEEEAEVMKDKYESIFTVIDDQSFYYNPQTYKIKVDTNLKLPETLSEQVSVALSFQDFNKDEFIFENKDFTKLIANQTENSFEVHMDLQKISEKLNRSSYSVNVKLNCLGSKFEDEFKVFFEKSDIVLQNNEGGNAQNLIPCFYSDKELKYSVPIYRDYVQSSNLFSNVIYSLAKDSQSIEKAGLKPLPLDVSFRTNMWFQNGRLRCGLYTDSLQSIQSKEEAEALVKNLSNSFAALPSNYIIHELELYMNDGAKQDIAGYSIAQAFPIERTTKVYLPYFVDSKAKEATYFWVPFDLERGEKIEDDVVEILDLYRRAPEYAKDAKFISLLPDIEPYKNISFVDEKLIIDLSDEMYEFLGSNKAYASMVKEGFALSFSSIHSLKGYELWHDNELIDEINGVSFGSHIEAPGTYNRLEQKGEQ